MLLNWNAINDPGLITVIYTNCVYDFILKYTYVMALQRKWEDRNGEKAGRQEPDTGKTLLPHRSWGRMKCRVRRVYWLPPLP